MILLMKICIGLGLCFLLTGFYLHFFNNYMATHGEKGIIIIATFTALGMLFSIPTKIYLTFLLMKREEEHKADTEKQ